MSIENKYKFNNKLLQEKSPYLLQHAHNPVDWYPWGGEAFARAIAEDKPIFLSIGYSTCHWCHVMERESFEDEEVAGILNKYFISIKVDREERPDIDHIYMTVCQALTGQGGWPLTILLTPEKKPFFAGTYFPKENMYDRIGLYELLEKIHIMWSDKRKDLLESSDQIISAVKESFYANADEDGEGIRIDAVDEGYNLLKRSFDRRYGGFSTAPKFPSPHNLLFMLRYWSKKQTDEALDMVTTTLESIYRGGIYDHVGFGFSRYSTDNKWLVPHFEKMLYDNALLAMVYLENYQITKKPLMHKVAEQIFTYVLRDMTSPEGGFYSAEDADSEGVEGKFYVWKPEEIIKILGDSLGQEFCSIYDISNKGNFEGESIPNLIKASDEKLDKLDNLDLARQEIFNTRERRIHPYKDDKILTSWNGLMIAALAMGGRVLNNQKYTDAAQRAYNFIINHLQRDDGRLMARYRDGESAILAYADDYTFMIWASIELYETTHNIEYLEKALELNQGLMEYFWDDRSGGVFLYGKDGEQLISRPKEIYDGAIPAANSQTTINLIRLSRILGENSYFDRAKAIIKTFGEAVNQLPLGHTNSLSSVLYAEGSSQEVVIVGEVKDEMTQKMIQAVHSKYIPFGVSIVYPLNNGKEQVERIIPSVMGRQMINGKSTAYVCRNFSCQAPVTSINELIEQLGN